MGNYIDAIRINNLSEVEPYVKKIPVIKYLSQIEELSFHKSVTFLVGENGTGKSTLLEAMATAYGFNAEGGSKNFSFATNKTHSNLGAYLKIIRRKYPKDGFFLRAESFYNVATEIERLPGPVPLWEFYGGKSLHQQSHGESFLALILNRFSGNGIYILDEPEAALSPSRQMTLMARMKQLERQNSQFIIATHSPILMAYPGAEIYELTEEEIKLTPYKETEHYIITKQFLDHPERMLNYLLED